MNKYCNNERVRTKKGVKYLYCIKKKAVIERNECKLCNCREIKNYSKNGLKQQKMIRTKLVAHKPINKVSKTNKVTKATSISSSVKMAVWLRDNKQCIFCHKPVDLFFANSHYIKRSHLGLGIEENIMTNCQECHELFEKGSKRKEMKEYAKKYFKSIYPEWSEDILIYRKNI